MRLSIDLGGLRIDYVAQAVQDALNAWAHTFTRPGYRGNPSLWQLWELPPLYSTRILARMDPGYGSGVELFRTPLETYAAGRGDCDGLSLYRLAELRAQAIDATARVDWIGGDMHARVRIPASAPASERRWVRGGIEDPFCVMEALNGKA